LKSTVTKTGSCERAVEVDITEEELTPHFERLYKRYQKNVKLEGFRKGKVPLSLIKKLYGDDIKSEAIDDVVKSVFYEVKEKEGFHPVAPAKLQDIQYDPEKGLHFKAVVEVVPDIELKHYTGLSVEKEVYQVAEEDVESALNDVREQMAVMQPVEGKAEAGHFVLADFQQLDKTGVPIIGKKFEDRFFQLTEDEHNKALASQLIGIEAGESRQIELPTAQEQAQSNGKDLYKVQVKEIKEKKLPELDDELAKDVGKFDNLEALKADIRQRLSRQTEQDSKRRVRQRLIDELLKKNAFDLPEAMITNYLDALVERARTNQNQPVDEQQLRQEYRAAAIWNLKWEIAKDKLIELEGIKVTEEDKNRFLARIAEERGVDEKTLRKTLKTKEDKARFEDDLLEELVLEFLEEHAKIKEKKITRKDLEKAGKLAVEK